MNYSGSNLRGTYTSPEIQIRVNWFSQINPSRFADKPPKKMLIWVFQFGQRFFGAISRIWQICIVPFYVINEYAEFSSPYSVKSIPLFDE